MRQHGLFDEPEPTTPHRMPVKATESDSKTRSGGEVPARQETPPPLELSQDERDRQSYAGLADYIAGRW